MATDPAPSGRPASEPGRSPRAGVAQVAGTEFSVATAVGGPRGIVETILPSLLFVVWFSASQQLRPALVLALVAAGIATLARLVQRLPLAPAVAGLVGVAVSAWFAQRTGQAQDFFLPGLLVNIGYSLAYALSVLVRWPAIGLIVGPLTGEGLAWRHDPARLRVYSRVTWLWVTMFLVRLAVQGPLYLTGQVAALGTARILMGVPFFALTAYVSWLMLRTVPPATPRPAREADRPTQPAQDPGT